MPLTTVRVDMVGPDADAERRTAVEDMKATDLWLCAPAAGGARAADGGLPLAGVPSGTAILIGETIIIIPPFAAVGDNRHQNESCCSMAIRGLDFAVKDAVKIDDIEAATMARCEGRICGGLQLQFCDESATEWRWMRQRHGSVASGGTPPAPEVLASTSATYVPQAADVGCWLRVECTPAASHPEEGLPVCSVP